MSEENEKFINPRACGSIEAFNIFIDKNDINNAIESLEGKKPPPPSKGELSNHITELIKKKDSDKESLLVCLQTLKKGMLDMRDSLSGGGAGGQLKNAIKSKINKLPPPDRPSLPPKFGTLNNTKLAEECCNPVALGQIPQVKMIANCNVPDGSEIVPKCYLCGLPLLNTELENKLKSRVDKLLPAAGLDVQPWKKLQDKLKTKVTTHFPSSPQVEHLQSIAQAAFTGILPSQEQKKPADLSVFAFAHRVCNTLKTNDEFIVFDKKSKRWVISQANIKAYYKRLYGGETESSINWYWSCYKRYVFLNGPIVYNNEYQKAVKQELYNKLCTLVNQLNSGGVKALEQQKDRSYFKHLLTELINKTITIDNPENTTPATEPCFQDLLSSPVPCLKYAPPKPYDSEKAVSAAEAAGVSNLLATSSNKGYGAQGGGGGNFTLGTPTDGGGGDSGGGGGGGGDSGGGGGGDSGGGGGGGDSGGGGGGGDSGGGGGGGGGLKVGDHVVLSGDIGDFDGKGGVIQSVVDAQNVRVSVNGHDGAFQFDVGNVRRAGGGGDSGGGGDIGGGGDSGGGGGGDSGDGDNSDGAEETKMGETADEYISRGGGSGDDKGGGSGDSSVSTTGTSQISRDNVQELRNIVAHQDRGQPSQRTMGTWADYQTLEILANYFKVCVLIYKDDDEEEEFRSPVYWVKLGDHCDNNLRKPIFLYEIGQPQYFQILKPKVPIKRAKASALKAVKEPENANLQQTALQNFELVEVPRDGDCGYFAFGNQMMEIISEAEAEARRHKAEEAAAAAAAKKKADEANDSAEDSDDETLRSMLRKQNMKLTKMPNGSIYVELK